MGCSWHVARPPCVALAAPDARHSPLVARLARPPRRRCRRRRRRRPRSRRLVVVAHGAGAVPAFPGAQKSEKIPKKLFMPARAGGVHGCQHCSTYEYSTCRQRGFDQQEMAWSSLVVGRLGRDTRMCGCRGRGAGAARVRAWVRVRSWVRDVGTNSRADAGLGSGEGGRGASTGGPRRNWGWSGLRGTSASGVEDLAGASASARDAIGIASSSLCAVASR